MSHRPCICGRRGMCHPFSCQIVRSNTASTHLEFKPLVGWFFWDETQSDSYGPYPSAYEAAKGMKRYADEQLEGVPPTLWRRVVRFFNGGRP